MANSSNIEESNTSLQSEAERIVKEKTESFNSNRLNHPTITKKPINTKNFVDVTDAYANSGLQLGFQHVPTGNSINFKAYITAFNETYSCDWASETVFGRIDPIVMFKQTTRNVTLSFKIVAGTPSEGYENLYRLDTLRSFLYPTYTDTGNAITLAQSPLIRLQVMNLLTNGATANTYNDMFGSGIMSKMEGALVIIKNMSVAHNLENSDVGVFHPGASQPGAPGPESDTDRRLREMGIPTTPPVDPQPALPPSDTGIIPKLIEVSLDLMVLHEANMGWQDNKAPGVYGIDMINTYLLEEDPPPSPTQAETNSAPGAASRALKDTRVAKWAQTLKASSAANSAERKAMRAARKETRQFYKSGEAATGASLRGDSWDQLTRAAMAVDINNMQQAYQDQRIIHDSWMDNVYYDLNIDDSEARYLMDDVGEIDYEDFSFSE